MTAPAPPFGESRLRPGGSAPDPETMDGWLPGPEPETFAPPFRRLPVGAWGEINGPDSCLPGDPQ
ncbi:hypothetical protein GCM10027160_38150 [Streptomyces calidiresistens]